MNVELATQILKLLSQSGVADYIVCAGARNAPFVKLLGQSTGARVSHFFDERAAGFFALGRARRDGRPVAVITTSGTAVAELLPSAIEAFYTGVPLVFVTADRPADFRGSAAPQAIEQVGIYSHYTKMSFDICELDQVTKIQLAADGMTHINICFSEPLIDNEVSSLDLSPPNWGLKISSANSAVELEKTDKNFKKLKEQIQKLSKPLVVLGAIPSSYRSAIFEQLQTMQAPIYAEALSGLREAPELAAFTIRCGSDLLTPVEFSQNFDSVIRIGSVPTLRLWRDLEMSLQSTPVISVCDLPFSGLARGLNTLVTFEQWLQNSKDLKFSHGENILNRAQTIAAQKEQLLVDHPTAEPSFFKWLSAEIPQNSQVFLGNSLPIREWDFAATTHNKNFKILANRGANGIDGLISTFLGSAKSEVENWIILGDLSALYDLNALVGASLAEGHNLRVVVVNNGGGQIFKKMFQDKNFINAHEIEFSKWAEMFSWDYVKVIKPETLQLKPRPTVIELCPSAATTELFWARYEELFR
ncbi:MAG: 2-succinyl-5-enolpyruvyl-6-hydroxy-3-cyclohexene-1-carboxylic-acid synthase [Bdellovibrionales bacterium]|nr:2-succinyl-5-enolpyruvyl-6-hydroxy-3-cyclohexene-1-carboxylic-acid synthase [Bdellovibrionales bacterium]